MPWIKTDILCNNKVIFHGIDVQITKEKPSAYEDETFVYGRIELPEETPLNLKSVFTIKTPSGKNEEITSIELRTNSGKSILRFRTSNPLDIKIFLPFECK